MGLYVVNSRLADTLLLRTPRYYKQKLRSWGIRITKNYTRYYGLSLLWTPNRGPNGVRYNESWLYYAIWTTDYGLGMQTVDYI